MERGRGVADCERDAGRGGGAGCEGAAGVGLVGGLDSFAVVGQGAACFGGGAEDKGVRVFDGFVLAGRGPEDLGTSSTSLEI